MMESTIRRIHFVGIGGIGMSGIAEVLVNQGFAVSGSDLRDNGQTSRLKALGCRIFVGHRAEQIGEADVVVKSTAVGDDNPEIIAARNAGVPVIPRAEMLAELMRIKRGIAIAGSHGKTTTTSLMAAAMIAAGLDPTWIIGGVLKGTGSNARLGGSEWLLAEADESDGSFALLSPIYTAVTNIDREHLDHYGSLEALHEAFVSFINKVPFFGRVVLNGDDPTIRALLGRIHRPFVTYRLEGEADYRAEGIGYEAGRVAFDALGPRGPLGRVRLALPGRHNVSNALAVVALADVLGLDQARVAQALAGFEGIGRRFEIVYRDSQRMIVDDYGHHPTEIRATLAAARAMWDGRLVACFQPHRFSRTAELLEDFADCFGEVDELILLDIYPASERNETGITSARLAELIAERHPTLCLNYLENSWPLREESVGARVLQTLTESLAAPGLLITLGAGDVTGMGRALARDLAPEAQAEHA